MARFPIREGEIKTPAQNIDTGLTGNAAVFPAPPVTLESEATLNNRELGKDWEYRIIAVNKAGEGAPSNTVAAVVV